MGMGPCSCGVEAGGVVHEGGASASHGLDVVGGNQEAGFTGCELLREGAHIGRDNGDARRHGLQRRQPEAFPALRGNKKVERAIPVVGIGIFAAEHDAIGQAGLVQQNAPRRFIEILKTVQVTLGESFGELRPHAGGFRAELEIDFVNTPIGRQAYAFDLSADSFRRDICRARTFGRMGDVNKLWSAGFALGASLDNSVVVDETRVLNTEGLRYADECVRHKVLDVVGDLALAGLPLLGLYRSVRGGHKLNHAVLTALMADRHAWRIVEATEPVLERPVVARRARGHADIAGGMVAVAFAPDVS